MSTYLVNHLRIPGVPEEENLAYLEQVEATTAHYGGKWLAIDGEVQVLEGAWPGSVVLIEFPDMETAQAWYNSPEYQKIIHLRTDRTVSDLVLVDGVSSDFTAAGYALQLRATIAAAECGS
ncbi:MULTISPECIES: DUF1330 domain-containing protein [Streptomyces]|uniref:DUF1330 domain-containing protein n=1 Tax=Streptomyces yanii TaxID=78510 RepID=A0ABV5R9T7_9ACTN